MYSRLGYETAQRIAAVWPQATSLAHAMELAGVGTKDARNQRRYRRQTEELLGIQLPPHNPKNSSYHWPHTSEHYFLDHPYTCVIFSDAHFWPNQTAPAFWILLQVIEDLAPEIVIDNGDSWDGATISRHDPIMFEDYPSLKDEYECCLNHLDMIAEVSKEAGLFRNIGNHDTRFEARLASKAPEYKGMPGNTVSELFPKWKHQWSLVLNDTVMIKHRWHGGVHAAYNNTLKAGVTTVTGHTHRLDVRPFTDFRGTRYGIETGTLADPYGPQFSYIEDNPRNWQPGFIVLTIDGRELTAERVEVKGDKALFRGKSYAA